MPRCLLQYAIFRRAAAAVYADMIAAYAALRHADRFRCRCRFDYLPRFIYDAFSLSDIFAAVSVRHAVAVALPCDAMARR